MENPINNPLTLRGKKNEGKHNIGYVVAQSRGAQSAINNLVKKCYILYRAKPFRGGALLSELNGSPENITFEEVSSLQPDQSFFYHVCARDKTNIMRARRT